MFSTGTGLADYSRRVEREGFAVVAVEDGRAACRVLRRDADFAAAVQAGPRFTRVLSRLGTGAAFRHSGVGQRQAVDL